VLAKPSRVRGLFQRSFRRDTETSTRDGRATRSEDLGGHRPPPQRKNGVRHRRPSIVGRLCEMAICLQKRKCRITLHSRSGI
jgi:hypothetical protein